MNHRLEFILSADETDFSRGIRVAARDMQELRQTMGKTSTTASGLIVPFRQGEQQMRRMGRASASSRMGMLEVANAMQDATQFSNGLTAGIRATANNFVQLAAVTGVSGGLVIGLAAVTSALSFVKLEASEATKEIKALNEASSAVLSVEGSSGRIKVTRDNVAALISNTQAELRSIVNRVATEAGMDPQGVEFQLNRGNVGDRGFNLAASALRDTGLRELQLDYTSLNNVLGDLEDAQRRFSAEQRVTNNMVKQGAEVTTSNTEALRIQREEERKRDREQKARIKLWSDLNDTQRIATTEMQWAIDTTREIRDEEQRLYQQRADFYKLLRDGPPSDGKEKVYVEPFDTAALVASIKQRQQLYKEFHQAVRDEFVMGAVEMVAATGQLLGAEGNLKNFGKTALLVVANTADQLGRLAIGSGLAIEALRESMSKLVGIPAIVAGTALVGIAAYVRSRVQNMGSDLSNPQQYYNAVTGRYGSTPTVSTSTYRPATGSGGGQVQASVDEQRLGQMMEQSFERALSGVNWRIRGEDVVATYRRTTAAQRDRGQLPIT